MSEKRGKRGQLWRWRFKLIAFDEVETDGTGWWPLLRFQSQHNLDVKAIMYNQLLMIIATDCPCPHLSEPYEMIQYGYVALLEDELVWVKQNELDSCELVG